jgi:hypothetical protein
MVFKNSIYGLADSERHGGKSGLTNGAGQNWPENETNKKSWEGQ